MKTFYAKFAGVIAALALVITATTANRACVFVAHQEKLPEGAAKLRRF